MPKRFLKKNLTKIIIITPILITLILVFISTVFIKQKLETIYDTSDVEVVEVRIPSLDLEKYKLLDKIGPQ